MPHSISSSLAEFVFNTQYDQLDSDTRMNAKMCLLDAIGVSIAATTLGEGCSAFHKVISVNEHSPCTLLGTLKKTSCVEAAWVNGALAHALDFEDAHDATLTHPNAAVIPAVLAVAEDLNANGQHNIDGKKLITSIVVGCEVVCRLASALDKPLDDFGWYPPPIFGAFGAVAAAAKLHELSPQQIVDAFSIVLCNTSCSAEIKYNPQSTIRAVRDSFSAQIGVQAVLLAKNGVKGFEFPLEGKAGFYNNFARGEYTPERIVNQLGNVFAINSMSFKAWPSCRGTHAFIEAAIALKKQYGIHVENIAKIEAFGCRINKMLAEPIATKQKPESAIDAKFSIPYVVAIAILFDDVTLEHFTEKYFINPAVLLAASKVSYHIDPELDDSPENMTSGYLKITNHQGDCFDIQISKPYGSPERPLSIEAITDKFRSCCGYSLKPFSKNNVDELIDTIFALEFQTNLSGKLFPLLSNSVEV